MDTLLSRRRRCVTTASNRCDPACWLSRSPRRPLMSAVLGTASTAGATLGAPLSSAFLDSEASDPVGGGQRLVLSTVTDNSGTSPGTTGSTSWALSGSGHTATLNLASPLGDPLTVGTYENAQGAPRTARPSAAFGHHRQQQLLELLRTLHRRRDHDEWQRDSAHLFGRFEQHCNGGDPALFGAVSYNATADFRA